MSLPEGKAPPGTQTGIEYSRTVSYVFENPNWLLNLVWLFVCQIVAGVIPMVPQMVVMGYQFEVIDGLLESHGTRHPDFNISRVVDYLLRGLWPFLAMLIVAMVWGIAFFFVAIIFGGCIAGAAGLAGKDAGQVIVIIGILIGALMALILFAALFFLAAPVTVRAGLAQDFAAAFDFAWIKDFIAKTWVEVLLSNIVLILAVLVGGTCTCGVGWIVGMGLVPMVQAHFWYQFYVLYLARGGTPVPLKAAPVYAAPPPPPAG